MSNNFDIIEALWLRREKKRRAQKIIEGALPLTYTAKNAGNLKNYRIYGQTVDGESVGDRTGNLFDGEVELGSWNITTQPCSKNDAYRVRMRNANFIKVAENSTYSITMSAEENVRLLIHFLDAQRNYISETAWLNNISNFNTPSQCEYINIIFKKGNNDAMALSDIFNIMLNAGSTPLPYEPYGYKVPVTVSNGTDTLTTSIYLPEQIKKVGDEAEYIDYREQKQHRVRKNLLQNVATSQTINGVTFTVNADGSVTLSGQLTANKADLYLAVTNSIILPSGEYYASCKNADTKYYFVFGGSPSTGQIPYTEIVNDNDIKVICRGGGIGYCLIRVVSDVDTPVILYPMIRKADIEDDTYEPYIETVDLDVTLPALPTLPGTNVLSVGTAVQPSKAMVRGKLKE